jgi:hypothetical protein
MGVQVGWDTENKKAIRYDFQGQWTWHDFRQATTEGFALTKSVKHRVDTISNFHPGANLPSDALFQFNRAMKNAPENRGVTVIVGGTSFIKNLVSIFSRVYKPLGKRLVLASSVEEARRKLAELSSQSTVHT